MTDKRAQTQQGTPAAAQSCLAAAAAGSNLGLHTRRSASALATFRYNRCRHCDLLEVTHKHATQQLQLSQLTVQLNVDLHKLDPMQITLLPFCT
jgi:hypothetical protein